MKVPSPAGLGGRRIPPPRSAGVTLLELLAALALSGLVVALASRIFLLGQKEFFGRVRESERLQTLRLAQGELERALRFPVVKCGREALEVESDSGTVEMGKWLASRFPAIHRAEFECWDLGASGFSLRPASPPIRPRWVEYRLFWSQGRDSAVLSGARLE